MMRAWRRWRLRSGTYRFGRYRKNETPAVRLVPPDGVDVADIARMAEAAALARDLINTPVERHGPGGTRRGRAGAGGSASAPSFSCIVGDDLLKQNYPLIHAVGRPRTRAPRLIDIIWGDRAASQGDAGRQGRVLRHRRPRPEAAAGMLIMKKDMGGAANVLALAQMVMAAGLKVRLRVLIPAVENAVAGNAFRPLDIVQTRKGTDGRDRQHRRRGPADPVRRAGAGASEKPDLMVDLRDADRRGAGRARPRSAGAVLATTTRWPTTSRAGRSARTIRCGACRCGRAYDRLLDSKVADINNAPSGGFAGAITAALFLQRFVTDAKSWLHVDIYGWTPSATRTPRRRRTPGRARDLQTVERTLWMIRA